MVMAQIFIELGLAQYLFNIASVGRYQGIIESLKHKGQKEYAQSLEQRLSLHLSVYKKIGKAEDRLSGDLYAQGFPSLLKSQFFKAGKVYAHKGWGLRAIDPSGRYLLFKGKEGYALKNTDEQALVSFELMDPGSVDSTIRKEKMREQILELDKSLWMLLPEKGLYRRAADEGVFQRINPDSFAGLELMSIFSWQSKLHVLAWNPSKNHSLMLGLVENKRWELQKIDHGLGKVNRLLLVDQQELLLMNSSDKYQRVSRLQQVLLLFRQEPNACRQFYMAQGLLHQGKTKAAHRQLRKMIQTYPQSLAAAEAWMILGEYEWLEQGDWINGKSSLNQAYQVFQQHRVQVIDIKGSSPENQWAGFRQLMFYQLVLGESSTAMNISKQMMLYQAAYQSLFFDLSYSMGKKPQQIKVGNKGKEIKARIVLVDLDEPYMRVLPIKPVTHENRSHYLGSHGDIGALFTPWRDHPWNESLFYLYHKPHQRRGRLGWVYLKDKAHQDWVWVVYHRLKGKKKAELEAKFKVINDSINAWEQARLKM